MYEGDVQSVLRCRQCNKPFDKESTLKRHGYYCRSRRVGSSPRSRSCISCAKGKARCDNRRPECSRCITKGIKCNYPAKTPKGTDPRIQHSDDAPTEQRRMAPSLVADSPSVENRQEASNDGNTVLDGTLVGGEFLDWDVPDVDFADFADFLNLQMNDDNFQYPLSGSSSLVRHSTPSTNSTVQVQQTISSPSVAIPAIPTSNPRSLIQRPKMKTGAQRIANLILHTLKSYPLMMIRHNTLPPFIHPGLLSSDVENNDMEPLTNCICLVHMISSGIQGSRKLFWKNVRMECERLCEEHLKLNKWELLAALQALSIYILIRLDEGVTDHNNLDFLLITTVTVLSKQFTRSDIICDTQSAVCNYNLEPSWKDWIFEESKRRICIVYQVLDMLVYFEPAAMCDLPTELILAPLPAKKQLWEAGDEFVWKAANDKDPGAQIDFGLAASGELVKLGGGRLYCGDGLPLYNYSSDGRSPSRNSENWEEWCSGMDGLGGLVMLAASLIA